MTSIIVDLYDQARREFPMPIDIEKRMERYHALVKERHGDVSGDGRVSAELTEGTQDRTLGSSPSPDTHPTGSALMSGPTDIHLTDEQRGDVARLFLAASDLVKEADWQSDGGYSVNGIDIERLTEAVERVRTWDSATRDGDGA